MEYDAEETYPIKIPLFPPISSGFRGFAITLQQFFRRGRRVRLRSGTESKLKKISYNLIFRFFVLLFKYCGPRSVFSVFEKRTAARTTRRFRRPDCELTIESEKKDRP